MSILKNKANAASETTTKKNEKKTIVINDTSFDKNLQKFAELKAQMDALEAQINLVKEDLKPVGMKILSEEYLKTGVFPGSFNVVSKSGATAMFIPQDKYKKLTKESFEYLDNKYNDVVADVVEFSLNPDVLNRPGVSEKFEKALVKALGEELTTELLTAKSTKMVKKGTIERALTVGKGKSGKVTIDDFWTDIEPTAFFKDPRK
jgi:hypothetical protein